MTPTTSTFASGGVRITLTSSLDGHRGALAVAGEIDLCTQGAFGAALAGLAAAGATEVALDLSEVTFAGASLLHELATARAAGAMPTIASATPSVHRVLVAGGLAADLQLVA
ncbi:MAG TPA: STAS domain-containing protein [Aquihabitans sp.]|nr:STAS domain-containing protein [Aquihabitans sp.]